MALPRFFSRVADAVGPVATMGPDALAKHLAGSTVAVHAPGAAAGEGSEAAAAMLAVNLVARLYPRLHLSGPTSWTEAAGEHAMAINPEIDLDVGPAPATTADVTTLDWAADPALGTSGHVVTVAADGWNAYVDPVHAPTGTAHPLSCLAAATLGVGELFRAAFAEALGMRGRRGRQPGGFNLITANDPTSAVPLGTQNLELPEAYLVGAGAVGQAFLLALVATGARTQLTVVDPQTIDLSNLQRYLLTIDTDVKAPKTRLAVRAADGSGVSVVPITTEWGADSRTGAGTADVVLTALDSAADRIAVAAGLPRRVYNAWTQPTDIGWSRHERFGTDPCLACLYYPNRPRPHEHELIAAALRQPPLRVLTYLVTRAPIGSPLPHVATVPDLPPPAEADTWTQRPLVADLVEEGFLDEAEAPAWAARSIAEVYRDGICAGGLIRLPGSGDAEGALVPLAHQSALAGIMLATTFLVSSDYTLQPHRPAAIEGRLDLLRGLPQILSRPRARTPGCLCGDPFYRRTASD
jgi:hypothetical protein